MVAPSLLVIAALAAASPAGPPTAIVPRSGSGEGGPERAAPAAENLLAGPARCLLRYLDAVRLAGPRTTESRASRAATDSSRWAAVRALTAPRTLDEIARRGERGAGHPLAPWEDAARGRVLDSFQLLAVRRAPRGAAIVTVWERYWLGDRDGPLERDVSEYLVGRVNGAWRVIDRRPGGTFDDAALARGYEGFFDAAPGPR
jgi:hypothetical protein